MQNYRKSTWQKGLYRSRDGVFFGVCKGLAEYLDFPVFWMRVIWVAVPLITILSIPVAILAYLIAAVVMKPEPVIPFEREEDREFYDCYVSSRHAAIHRLKRTYENLDRRLQRMEAIVTSADYQWDRKFSEGGRGL